MTEKLLDSFVQISNNLKEFIDEYELYNYHPSADEEEFISYLKQNLNNDYIFIMDDDNSGENVIFFGDKQKVELELNRYTLTENSFVVIFNIKEDKEVGYTVKVTVDD